jgi:hypothetical protein
MCSKNNAFSTVSPPDWQGSSPCLRKPERFAITFGDSRPTASARRHGAAVSLEVAAPNAVPRRFIVLALLGVRGQLRILDTEKPRHVSVPPHGCLGDRPAVVYKKNEPTMAKTSIAFTELTEKVPAPTSFESCSISPRARFLLSGDDA